LGDRSRDRHPSPEDFAERFSEGIQALSAHQDLLVRNQRHGGGIEELVRARLAPFADLIGPRFVVRGPKLRLNATSSQAIGLALHELATNAGKYGALSKVTARLDIQYRRPMVLGPNHGEGVAVGPQFSTAAARVRHYRYETDDGVQRRRCGRS
jgi:two-component sensor histidine kinase